MSDKDYAIKENIAAICINFGASEKYDDALESAAARASGSSEFYSTAIEAAEVLEKVAKKLKITWGENAEWPLTVDAYAEAILDFAIETMNFPRGSDLEKLAEKSIDWN